MLRFWEITKRQRDKERRLQQSDPAKQTIFYESPDGEQSYITPAPSVPITEDPDFPPIPEIKRFTFTSETVWTVVHNFGNLPLINIWEGAAEVTYGFGTAPFGTSPFGGGTYSEGGAENTDEPVVEIVDENSFTITWTEPKSGTVVVGSGGGITVEAEATWDSITGKPSTFTPATHANEAHDPNFAEATHDHDLAYADIDHDHDDDYLNKANTGVYTPSGDYHPATKKYVDDNAGGGAFTELTDTPADYTGQAGKIPAVNVGEDALEFIDAPSPGGAENFLALDDTPSAYTGQAGKVATVNVGEDALIFDDAPAAANGLPAGGTAGQMLAKIDAADYNAEWVAAPLGGAENFTELDDTPANYTDQAGKFLKVNAGTTALEFTDAPSGAWEVVTKRKLSEDESSVELTDLSDYDMLRITFWGLLEGTGNWRLAARYNGDTGNNYYIQQGAGGSTFTQNWHTLHNSDRSSGHAAHLQLLISKPQANKDAYITTTIMAGAGSSRDNYFIDAIWNNATNKIDTVSLFDRAGNCDIKENSVVLVEGVKF